MRERGGGRGVVSSSFFVFELKPRARESDKEFDRIEAEEAPWLLKCVALSAYRKRNLRGVLSEPPLKEEGKKRIKCIIWEEQNCIGRVFSRAASLDDLDDVDAPPDRPAVQGLPVEEREHVELRRGHHGAGPAAAEAAAVALAAALAREV